MIGSVSAHDFASFRAVARSLVLAGIAPRDVRIRDPHEAQGGLFDTDMTLPRVDASRTLTVPRRYFELTELAVLHRSDDRFDLPYRVLYRLAHGEPHIMEDELDDDVRNLTLRVEAIGRDEHRMHAFVRFRAVQSDEGERYVAFYRPEHRILRLGAPFFARRFANMRWSILTPDESAHWDEGTLRFGPAASASEAPNEDELEALFRTYYASTYNPARQNTQLFDKHVPVAFRRLMPELSAALPVAVKRPEQARGAVVPSERDLSLLARTARACDACPLAGPATQTVFGEGPSDARVMLVGEQPGDQEDLVGRPFVGPAGQLLDRALVAAALSRDALYVTNAVKHFGYRPMGHKKRLHVKPEWQHLEACRPWLMAELETVRPDVVVCLGASAAQSLFGRRFALRQNRGRVFQAPFARAIVVTHHPSALLRMDEAARAVAYEELVSDLCQAAARAKAVS